MFRTLACSHRTSSITLHASECGILLWAESNRTPLASSLKPESASPHPTTPTPPPLAPTPGPYYFIYNNHTCLVGFNTKGLLREKQESRPFSQLRSTGIFLALVLNSCYSNVFPDEFCGKVPARWTNKSHAPLYTLTASGLLTACWEYRSFLLRHSQSFFRSD